MCQKGVELPTFLSLRMLVQQRSGVQVRWRPSLARRSHDIIRNWDPRSEKAAERSNPGVASLSASRSDTPARTVSRVTSGCEYTRQRAVPITVGGRRVALEPRPVSTFLGEVRREPLTSFVDSCGRLLIGGFRGRVGRAARASDLIAGCCVVARHGAPGEDRVEPCGSRLRSR